MANQISIEDARTMYRQSLVLYKGNPITVYEISHAPDNKYLVEAWDLAKQQFIRFTFEADQLKAPDLRLGFLNLGTNCTYLHRHPARIYKVGFNNRNVDAKPCPKRATGAEEKRIREVLEGLSCLSLYNTLNGVYPSLPDALKQLTEGSRAVAFDRQFCITDCMSIYFKETLVGHYCKEKERIEFLEEYRYLATVLPKGVESC